MEIQITGRNNFEITPPIRQHVIKQFEKVKKHFNNITNIHVILMVLSKYQHKAEAHVDLPLGNLFAEETSEDMYASIDLVSKKIERQVVRHKEELKNHKGEGL